MELPSTVAANPDATIVVNATGDGLAVGPTTTAIVGAEAQAIAAAASATDAANSAITAQEWASTGPGGVPAGGAAKDWATYIGGTVDDVEYSAKQYALNSAASALQSAASAEAGLWKDVVFLSAAGSPYTIIDGDKGNLYIVDATAGNVVINLPLISTLDLSQGWSIGVKKSDGTANTVTINANAADVVEGAATFVLSRQNFGATLIPDIDPVPDAWTAVYFGDVRNLYSPNIFTPQTDVVAYATQGSTPATPAAGYVRTYFKTLDQKMYVVKSDGSETALGSGSGGGINYITNPDIDAAITGWNVFADASASRPSDGAGGSPVPTLARST